MHAVLFDDDIHWKELLPLTFTRPAGEIRIGILTIAEKWERYFGKPSSFITQGYLTGKFTSQSYDDSICINSRCCPTPELVTALSDLKKGEVLKGHGITIACYGDPFQQNGKVVREYNGLLQCVNTLTDIFTKNHEALVSDFLILTRGRKSEKLSNTVTVIGDPSLVFLEKGARAEACILNTTNGPVYLGKDAEVMEGCAVRGPFALCEHSALKMNAKVYGATTIGPHCKVGGEVSNSVIFGYSNKAHDGFLGNSVIGEWCNLGADTNNSNLKNNYGNVKLYNYRVGALVDTGLQFCGLIMGDHSKSAINTMFNTGTVIGVGANVFGGGFPPKHIPSFSWGGSEGFEKYDLDKMLATAAKVFERRGLKLNETERGILRSVQQGNW